MSPDDEFRPDTGASIIIGSWTVEMNCLKKLFANLHSSFAIDLLAYWNDRIFPHDRSGPSFQYQPLLVNNQQHEYDNLLIDVEHASVNSSGLESEEDVEDLAQNAHRVDYHTRLSRHEARSDALESGERYESDDGERVLGSGDGEEGEGVVYESGGGEYAEEEHHPVLMPIARQMIMHNTTVTQVWVDAISRGVNWEGEVT